MHDWMRRLRNERGSALLISLVLTFVMTLLGVALFDLSVVESTMFIGDETDARALEIAQAGLERAFRDLEDPSRLVNGSWANAGLSTSDYGTGVYVNQPFRGGGTYSIEYMNVTVADANAEPFGQPCRKDVALPSRCADLMLVRSRGTITSGTPGDVRTRAIQVLARIEPNSPFASAVSAITPESASSRALIAGSIHFLACPAPGVSTCEPFRWDSTSSGQRNHYQNVASSVRDRIEPAQRVCPVGRTCPSASNLVYSLGATFKMASPPSSGDAVRLTSATLGQSADSASYTHDGVSAAGKGRIDNVYVTTGCTGTCSGSFNTTSLVNVDDGNIKKPYPRRPIPRMPRLTDPVTIAGISYQHYACPTGCGADTHYFTSKTLPIMFDDFENLSATAPPFTATWTYITSDGLSRQARLCWTGDLGVPAKVMMFAGGAKVGAAYVPLPPFSGILGNPLDCISNLTGSPGNPEPIMLWLGKKLVVKKPGGGVYYAGRAVVLVNDKITIEDNLQPFCPVLPCTRKFPQNDMLVLMTPNKIEIKDDAAISMAMFFTEDEFYAKGNKTVVGSVAARYLKLEEESGQIPKIVEAVPYPIPREMIPGRNGAGNQQELFVSYVPKFWKECWRNQFGTSLGGARCAY